MIAPKLNDSINYILFSRSQKRILTILLISLLNSVFRFGDNVSRRLLLVSKTAPVFLANKRLRVFLPDAGGPIIIVAEAKKNNYETQ